MTDTTDRADAASQLIVIAVQQAATLPPASAQAFTWQFDRELGTFVPSEQLGPSVLRATNTIGANRLSVRFGSSYFELDQTFDPLIYSGTGGPIPPQVQAFTAFGLAVNTDVVLFNLAATYGITDRIEATLNIPFSVVQVSASQTFLTFPPPFPPATAARTAFVPGESPAIVQQALDVGVVALREQTFPALGADFNSGEHVGLGRISVGAKGVVLASDRADLALSGEFFCNSPSEEEYAGSNSPSILPRAIGQVRAASHLNLLADVGYEYDFEVAELTRFVWNAGISIPVLNATFDFGVGGSLYDEEVVFTPTTAVSGEGTTIRAVDPSKAGLGTNYIDALVGIKMRLFDGLILNGGVAVPVTDDGLRPAAIGMAALEYYFH